MGTPEEIAETPESYTGEWLRHVLGLRGKATVNGQTEAALRGVKANGADAPPPAKLSPAARSTATKATNGRAAKNGTTNGTPAKATPRSRART